MTLPFDFDLRQIRLLLISSLLLHSIPVFAQSEATVSGLVTGPDGVLAGARVIAMQSGGDEFETTTNSSGQYSMVVPTGHYSRFSAEPADSGSGLVAEWDQSRRQPGRRSRHVWNGGGGS